MSSTAEIIKVIDGQLIQGEELHLFLDSLTRSAKEITVKDRESCGEAQELVKKGQQAIKSVMLAAEPDRMRLQKAKDDLLAQRDKIVATILTVTDPLDRAARKWVLDEKAAAQREQDRANQQARDDAARLNAKIRKPENKVTPQTFTVAPDLPKVPGTRVVEHYRFEIIDPKKVKREFWCIDEQAIGKKCRDDKNIKKSMEEIGGVRVWVE